MERQQDLPVKSRRADAEREFNIFLGAGEERRAVGFVSICVCAQNDKLVG